MTWLVLLLACEPVHVTCERPREDEEASSTRAPDGSLPVDTGTAPVDSTPPAATDTAGVLVDSGTTAVLDDTAQPVVGEVDCGGVGASDTDGFFELVGFDGRLYAGQFGYGQEHRSMLYRTDPWELTSPGLTGVSESVCAMVEHDGWLYANTESSGDIQRSADGAHWDRVLDGESGTIGFIGGVGGFGLIEKFEAGFVAGAQAVNPDIEVIQAGERHFCAGAIGARMTGGGFGGSAIALTPAAAEQQVRAAVGRAFAAAGYTTPDIFSVRPAAGAMRLA